VVVIGTMGNIINIEELLKHKLCKKILNNLEPSKYIDETLFEKIYYEKATIAREKIKEDIKYYRKQEAICGQQNYRNRPERF